MKNRILLNGITVFIGLMFLSSGITKAMDINSFGEILKTYGSKYLYFIAPFLSSLEILLGFGLVFLVNPKKLAFISLALTFLFTIIFAFGYLFLDVNDCGCFGSILKIPPFLTFIRNAVIIWLAWNVWVHYPDQPSSKWGKVRLSTAIVFGLVSLLVAFLDLTASFKQSQRFNESSVYSTLLPKLIKLPSSKRYLVFMFLPTCSHCQKAVPNVKKYKEDDLVDDIVGIYPSHSNPQELKSFTRNFSINFLLKSCRADSMNMLSKIYPTVFVIRNDTIHDTFIGSVPLPKESY
ncbi:MAG: hypothetical protein KA713_00225 [Chryseotalea sp. WA131a]|jgi:hypothetical protein|nr:MAG: hypothetical protein KA713_00225 [Chryseotalea sp. WA131a]